MRADRRTGLLSRSCDRSLEMVATVSGMDPLWPDNEMAAMRRPDGSFYLGAAICRRGHVESAYLDPRRTADRPVAENCTACGARVLTACPTCQRRIRGDYHVPDVFTAVAPARPSFCDGCGGAFPWASREERIFELENLLDEEDVDEADRVVIQDQLARLRSADLSEKEERQAWETIKKRGGAALTSGPVKRVIEGLVSAAIRAQIGL